MIVYGYSLTTVKIGYFGLGMFHLKSMLSYSHMIELLDNKDRAICQTIITVFDEFSIALVCLFFIYVN